MSRPNLLDDVVLAALTEAGNNGVTADAFESAEIVLTEQATLRGVKSALLRLFRQGSIVRAFEFTENNDGRPYRRYRYWLEEFAPTENPHLEAAAKDPVFTAFEDVE